ncbi:MAG: hypothetical protein HOM58_16630 [Rhodospirillaceae bacterium]|jgi:hypothetical protein|nr:hypothetical protein [Rhodospirillaceae bacterium]MBT5455428.1 hypothetical protein [Rhodospirillaceae bacterium]
MPDFWKTSGYHLLELREDGLLGVTDDFLRAYFRRPELQLEPESCAAEQALNAALLENPRREVESGELAAIEDSDVRENYNVVLDFRDRLIAAGTVEACYLTLFQSNVGTTPPLFIDQMAHVILRRVLDGCDDTLQLRAAELFFRTQKVSLNEGAILMADEETIEMKRETGGLGNLGRFLIEMETSLDQVELDVLSARNAGSYWDRSDRYDMVYDASFGQPGLGSLCRVLEAWMIHLLGVETAIEPVREIQDERWVWHIGLDMVSSAILNDLYDGVEVDEDRTDRLIALFRLEFKGDVALRPEVGGRPVYLGLAMNDQNIVTLKPQNLLVNLPLAPAS